jgi:hypothetical protein
LWEGDRKDDVLLVEIPTIPDLLEPEDFHHLTEAVNPLQGSEDNGVDLYFQALNLVIGLTEGEA